MPPVSQAQRRWAYWTASGKNPNTPASVGKEFEGQGIKGLPARIHAGMKKIGKVRHA